MSTYDNSQRIAFEDALKRLIETSVRTLDESPMNTEELIAGIEGLGKLAQDGFDVSKVYEDMIRYRDEMLQLRHDIRNLTGSAG